MIGLDTNVLVRYLTLDDPAQAAVATAEIDGAAGRGEILFIGDIVLCELVWVLEDCYDYDRPAIAAALERMLRTAQFAFQDKDLLWQALADYQGGKGDFSDQLIGRTASKGGCEKTLTFDAALKGQSLFRVLK